MDRLLSVLDACSQWSIPLAIVVILAAGAYRRVPVYESFVTGAKEGFGVAVMIIPYLVAMLFAIKVFVASGVFADLKWVGQRVLDALGCGQYAETLDLLPLALTRPLSGSGARGVMLEVFDEHGPDSFLGMTASLMMGSTETTFYVLTIYYGAVQIKKLRHTLPACLLADLAGLSAALVFGWWFFKN